MCNNIVAFFVLHILPKMTYNQITLGLDGCSISGGLSSYCPASPGRS